MERQMISRTEEQKLSMMCIYDALLYSYMDEQFSIEELMEGIFNMPFDEIPLFSRSLVVKSLSHINEIIPIYQEKMPKWNFTRLNNLEKAILLMSYANYKYLKESDKNVVINTAIVLSKKYLDKDDYKFVNAILDKVL